MNIIDTNVYLSRWPFRRLNYDETSELVAKLRGQSVEQAWAGSFDGLLHKNISAVNERLAKECRERGEGLLVPFGSINPKLPDWEEDLRRCHEEHKMPGIRLHPNYHGYKLDEPVFERLLRMASERDLVVQLAVMMEDRRTQHPMLQIPPVDLTKLPGIMQGLQKLKLVLLNSFQSLRGEPLLKVMASGEICFDIATLEGIGAVGTLIKQIPLSRVVFGSYAPFFILESAVLKIKEAGLNEQQSGAIREENARRILQGR